MDGHDPRGLKETVETWHPAAVEHIKALGESFAQFRRELRQLLMEHGVASNPGWSEHNIVEAFRDLLRKL